MVKVSVSLKKISELLSQTFTLFFVFRKKTVGTFSDFFQSYLIRKDTLCLQLEFFVSLGLQALD